MKNPELMLIRRRNSKPKHTSLQDIRLARQKLIYESLLYEEKLKHSSERLLSGISGSLKNLGFYIRNRLLTWAFFRSVSKSAILYDFLASFRRGFKKTMK